MKNKFLFNILFIFVCFGSVGYLSAQNNLVNVDSDKTRISISPEDLNKITTLTKALSRLTLGGYGEAVATQNFYSDNFNRYSQPEKGTQSFPSVKSTKC